MPRGGRGRRRAARSYVQRCQQNPHCSSCTPVPGAFTESPGTMCSSTICCRHLAGSFWSRRSPGMCFGSSLAAVSSERFPAGEQRKAEKVPKGSSPKDSYQNLPGLLRKLPGNKSKKTQNTVAYCQWAEDTTQLMHLRGNMGKICVLQGQHTVHCVLLLSLQGPH